MLPRDDDDDDEERTATRDETFTPEFNLLRPRQTGNERMPMPTTHGELDEEAVATAAICLLGAAIAPATPASTTIAIATPKPSIPVSVSLLLSLPPLAPSLFFTRIGKPPQLDWNSARAESVGRPVYGENGDRGIAGRATEYNPPPPLGYGVLPPLWLWRLSPRAISGRRSP
jgi:hypothetical protein